LACLNCLGQVLTKENVVDVIKFAYKEKLFLLADEVMYMYTSVYKKHLFIFTAVISILFTN